MFTSCTSPVDWVTAPLPPSVAAVVADERTWTSPLEVAGRFRGTGEGLAGGAGGGANDWLAGSTQPGLVDVWVKVSST